jgi:hypothetical protein
MSMFQVLFLVLGCLCATFHSQSISLTSAAPILVPSYASTPLVYDTLLWEVSFANVSLPTTEVILPNGIYLVTATFYVLPPSPNAKVADNRSIIVYVNGTENVQQTVAAVNSDQTRLGISTVVYVSGNNATVPVAINAYQQSGESLYIIDVTLTIVKVAY